MNDSTTLIPWLQAIAIVLLVLAGIILALVWAPDKALDALRVQWAPPPSTFINVKGLQVHMRDEGPRDDPLPLVLLHGTSASLHTWEGWVAALKSKHRVITMDLPGFGLTGPNPQNDYCSDANTRFVLDFLDALGVQRCVLGGNSLGGQIAWQAALTAPQRVARLILVDAAGYPMQPQSFPLGLRIALTPVLNTIMQFTLTHHIIAASVRDVYGEPKRVTKNLVNRYYDLTLRAGNRRALVLRLKQWRFGDQSALIASVRQPTLILWGKRDHLIPIADGYRFHKDIADSQLAVFDELGHVPHEEEPQATVAAVRAFLES